MLLDRVGSSMFHAVLIQLVACVVALVASLLAFMLTSNLAGFVPVFSTALLGLFVTTAPLCSPHLPYHVAHPVEQAIQGLLHERRVCARH